MRLLFYALLISLVSGVALADVSGIYAAANDDSAEIFSLVESRNGDLVGQYEFISIGRNYKVKTVSKNLTGRIHNGHVAMALGAPIGSWFSSTTMTGEISRGLLKLLYEGTNTRYLKVSSSQREVLFQRISNVANKRAYDAFISRAQTNFKRLTDNVEILALRIEDDLKWYAATKESYSKLFAEGRTLEERLEMEEKRDAYGRDLYKTNHLIYEVNRKVWALDRALRGEISSVVGTKNSITEVLKALEEACPKNDSQKGTEFCSKVKTLEVKFKAMMNRLADADDDLTEFRNSVNI